jgi:hypothetical protein
MRIPPPKPKKLIKNEAAEKAMAMPNNMEIPRLRPDPDSEKARPRPKRVTAITPPAWATGPVRLSTILLRGPSHGMPEPLARAADEARKKAVIKAGFRMDFIILVAPV